jgi:hypothetical protein
MKTIKIINSHAFDVKISIVIEDNGSDDPLQFLEFFNATSDVNSKSKSRLPQTSVKCLTDIGRDVEHVKEDESDDGSFEIHENLNEVIDSLENVNVEVEKVQVVETLLRDVIESIKVNVFMSSRQNYTIDWIFPNNPRQIECNKYSFTLRAHCSDEIKIFVTPNYIGKFIKFMKIRSRILMQPNAKDYDESITTMPIKFECDEADIKINRSNMTMEAYADNEINSHFTIENCSRVDGFFMLPNYVDSQIKITFECEKIHIPPHASKRIDFKVISIKTGEICRQINLVALASNKHYPISIECKSLAPDVIVKPNKIIETDLVVLKQHDARIFIENRSRCKVKFLVKLEHDDENLSVFPCGGILGYQQCVLVMLKTFFYDPTDYRNTVIIRMGDFKTIVSETIKLFQF